MNIIEKPCGSCRILKQKHLSIAKLETRTEMEDVEDEGTEANE